jgi:hypothetical protein
MPAKSLRDEWKAAKAANKAFDVSKVMDQQKFGPKLDKYEAAAAQYSKVMKVLAKNPDDKKEEAAKKAVTAAAKDAAVAGAKYLQAMQFIEKNSTGPAKAAADKLTTVLSMHILRHLDKVAKGDVSGL